MIRLVLLELISSLIKFVVTDFMEADNDSTSSFGIN